MYDTHSETVLKTKVSNSKERRREREEKYLPQRQAGRGQEGN